MLNCKDCIQGTGPKVCEACREMQQEGRWLWEIDNGHRICRCPECGFGNIIHAYTYRNPFRYCAGCGKQMIFGEQLGMWQTTY